MHGGTSIAGLVVSPPLLNGSGVIDVVSSDEGWNLPAAQVAKLGAFTTKTITRSARPGHAQPWADTIGPGTLVNAAGLPNPGIERAMLDWAHLPQLLGIPAERYAGSVTSATVASSALSSPPASTVSATQVAPAPMLIGPDTCASAITGRGVVLPSGVIVPRT